MALEKKTNPFLRPHSSNLQETIDLVGQSDVEVFARTRELKDNF
jgi:hydroxyacylglutathione hydrolase